MTPPNGHESYWPRLAAAYKFLGSPLRPSDEDVQVMEQAVEAWHAANPGIQPRALILGATPALALMRWPTGTRLIGADSSHGAMHSIWPGNEAGARLGICANWMNLPLAAASVHIAIGDGALICTRYPEEARALCASVRGVLHPTGVLILRAYIRPERAELPEQVFAAMFNGSIATFTQFKFRLLLSMAGDVRRGVPVDEVYRVWAAHSIDVQKLAGITGWPVAEIKTMEGYRGAATVHSFPSLTELRGILDESFDELSATPMSYPSGEHCPIFVLRPRPGVR